MTSNVLLRPDVIKQHKPNQTKPVWNPWRFAPRILCWKEVYKSVWTHKISPPTVPIIIFLFVSPSAFVNLIPKIFAYTVQYSFPSFAFVFGAFFFLQPY